MARKNDATALELTSKCNICGMMRVHHTRVDRRICDYTLSQIDELEEFLLLDPSCNRQQTRSVLWAVRKVFPATLRETMEQMGKGKFLSFAVDARSRRHRRGGPSRFAGKRRPKVRDENREQGEGRSVDAD